MSGKKRTSVEWVALKLKGKTFAFTGRLIFKKHILAWIKREGGKLLPSVTDKLDYLVVGEKRSKALTSEEQKAARLNQKGAHIASIGEDDFAGLLTLTLDEAAAMLRAGDKGIARWQLFQEPWAVYQRRTWHRIDAPAPQLRRIDLRHAKLDGVHLAHPIDVRFDGADLGGAVIEEAQGCNFSKAHLDRATLTDAKNCNLDGATLRKANKLTLTDCSLKKADLSETYDYEVLLRRCDVTGACLAKTTLHNLEAPGAQFAQAALPEADFSRAKLAGADFSRAAMNGAYLVRADLKKAVLVRANLHGADLTEANLSGADLTDADLRDACLAGTNLKHAIIDGANFTGAYLSGADLAGLDPSTAKGLNPAANATCGKAGPCVAELEKVIRKDDWLETSAVVALPLGDVTFEVTRYRPDSTSFCTKAGRWHHFDYPRVAFAKAMKDMTRIWTGGKLRVDSISASTRRGRVPEDQLNALARAAWCELFDAAAPSTTSLKEQHDVLRQEMLTELRGGHDGVWAWNRRPDTQHSHLAAMHPLNLAGEKLREVRFEKASLIQADFSGADLHDAWFTQCDCSDANFAGADVSSTLLIFAKFAGACFDGAKLIGADLGSSNCSGASFRNADLTGAKLERANLRGATLTGAKVGDVVWTRCEFDEKTRFPRGFTPTEAMAWCGQGPPPGLPGPRTPGGAISFEIFLTRLKRYVDIDRLARAQTMLKADRFQLFAVVKQDGLIGVVKSQTDRELVYSCRLGYRGDFGCCTQNLNVCGGLRGGLCKHLLVLIVGLVKAGKLDPACADAWTDASRANKPALDRELMSETFLRYKGAEAGEIDWRPTETIPEDYYAM
jgi:uncharacterized protein YjbI with pentapeptide repeats